MIYSNPIRYFCIFKSDNYSNNKKSKLKFLTVPLKMSLNSPTNEYIFYIIPNITELRSLIKCTLYINSNRLVPLAFGTNSLLHTWLLLLCGTHLTWIPSHLATSPQRSGATKCCIWQLSNDFSDPQASYALGKLPKEEDTIQ